MLWNIIFKKKRKKIDPTTPIRDVYVWVWHEDRLLLLKSVPENMKNLSFTAKMQTKFINYFKFLSIPRYIKWMIFWIMLDIIIFKLFPVTVLLFYYFAFKYLVNLIFIELAWKKNHHYFKHLKAENIKKKYNKKKIFWISFFLIAFIIYFLNPLFFLTLFK